MTVRKETQVVTINVVSVPGNEYDRWRSRTRLVYSLALALLVLAAFAFVFGYSASGWSLLITFFPAIIMAYVLSDSSKDRMCRDHGWSGQYPLKIVPEYQSLIHE